MRLNNRERALDLDIPVCLGTIGGAAIGSTQRSHKRREWLRMRRQTTQNGVTVGAITGRCVCTIGTAGWTRTTDLLIHSQHQVFDFPRVCWKCLCKMRQYQWCTDSARLALRSFNFAILRPWACVPCREALHKNTWLASCCANGSDLSDPDRTTNMIGQRRPCPRPSASKIMRHHPAEVFP